MGREIRKVPNNFMTTSPMHDLSYKEAVRRWKKDYALWEENKHEAQKDKGFEGAEFWEYEAPPDCFSFFPFEEHERTHFQLWEDVSYGTPVTPAFATLEGLAYYLATEGDFWDQCRNKKDPINFPTPAWGWEKSLAFIRSGASPSFMIKIEDGETKVYHSNEIPLEMERTRNCDGKENS